VYPFIRSYDTIRPREEGEGELEKKEEEGMSFVVSGGHDGGKYILRWGLARAYDDADRH
jgi:hypothetical protein